LKQFKYNSNGLKREEYRLILKMMPHLNLLLEI